jgi:hypothetical protein
MLLLLLVGGAIVNVAVAWGFTRYGSFSKATKLGETQVFDAFTVRAMLQPSRRLDGHSQSGHGLHMTEAAVFAESENGGEGAYLMLFDAGWPMTSLRAEWRGVGPIRTLDASIHLHAGKETSRQARDGQYFSGHFVYPTTPIWPGFAINTLFYAAILWMLFAAPFALRQRSRIKRGLCPACAYPVGESPICTECGGDCRVPRLTGADGVR